jgi:ABC-type polysaccharide/polyol phosphate export permease
MFYAILLVTLAVALVTSILVVRFFNEAVKKILSRIVGDDLAEAWRKYMSFAIVVVGVSGGVRIWDLEKFVPNGRESALELNGVRWTIQIYRTVIDTLSQIAWVMLLFFLCTMVAYVIMRAVEARASERGGKTPE